MSKLSKSLFSLGFECHAKLYFKRHSEYHSILADDPFMESLAEGGYQVGEYARWMLCDNPLRDTIETLDEDAAVAETAQRMAQPRATIAEGAFRTENLLIRADIVVKEGKTLSLYEVKSKSWGRDEAFWIMGGAGRLSAKWEKYLLDVAFQKYVLEKARPDFNVKAFLVVLDKDKVASVAGLNQMFPIRERNGRRRAEPRIAAKEQLGADLLEYIDVDCDIDSIFKMKHDLPQGGIGTFADLIGQLSDIYQADKPFYCGVGTQCKTCQFRLPSDRNEAGQLVAASKKSGMDECWGKVVGRGYDPAQTKIIDLWNYRQADERIRERKFFLRDLSREDLGTGKRADRQWLQIEKAQRRDISPWMDNGGLHTEMTQWTYPLHFIDFETSRMALPVHRGGHPYMQVAFQFSHHTVAKDGQIRHAGQWIEARAGVFPSFQFVRELKLQLEADQGTIFRYAAHENSVLRDIRDQLESSSEPDRWELMAWIDTITESRPQGSGWGTPKIAGHRNMVDMKRLVVDYHYDPATRGSNSLKAVLPAIIKSSAQLRKRFGQPLKVSGVHSLNCPLDWTWIRSECGNNPYAALPPVFSGNSDKILSDYAKGLDEVGEGGAAMIAYAKLQYCELPDAEREAIRMALLRYCELDTLAMVMLYEYWENALST